MRPQGSSPLDALIPFTPSRTFPHGAAPGIAPFRAFLLPLVRGLFPSTEPSWHCLTRSSNASNRATGPTISRGSRTLVSGWVGCLQGFCPCGKPDHCTTGLGVCRGRCPPGFQSSLGFSPPSPPSDRRHPLRSRASFTIRSLASPDRDRTTAFSQTWKWRVLSRECQPFRGFSLVPPASSKTMPR